MSDSINHDNCKLRRNEWETGTNWESQAESWDETCIGFVDWLSKSPSSFWNINKICIWKVIILILVLVNPADSYIIWTSCSMTMWTSIVIVRPIKLDSLYNWNMQQKPCNYNANGQTSRLACNYPVYGRTLLGRKRALYFFWRYRNLISRRFASVSLFDYDIFSMPRRQVF